MNKYPTWWSSTVTIYNRAENSSTHEILWYKHVLHGCFKADTYVRDITDKQVSDANKLIVRIPQSSYFIPHGEWNTSSSSTKQTYFTLQLGDIIVLSEVADIIDEYPAAGATTLTSTELIAKYKKSGECLTIEQYQDNTGDDRSIPHYRVIGI